MKDVDDDSKLYAKFLNKRNNAKKEGIRFCLTFEEFKLLVVKANLRSSDLGYSGRGYVLARYNDRGPYKSGNCRFITQAQNLRERRPGKISPRVKAAARTALECARIDMAAEHGSLSAWCAKNGRKGAATRAIQVKKLLKEKDRKLLLRKVNLQFVNYPHWGWKSRLANQLSLTSRELAGFINRNPDYESTL
jgi:hypothetical protein